MNVLAVIGCAPCWADDLEEFKKLVPDFDVLAVGLDCPYTGRIKYMATYHTEDIPVFKKKRTAEGLNTDYEVIAHLEVAGVKWIIRYESPSGSSALLGAMFATTRYDKIVLVGCPLQGNNDRKYAYENFHKGWTHWKHKLGNKVRSMSGWTAEFLKKPDEEWLRT